MGMRAMGEALRTRSAAPLGLSHRHMPRCGLGEKPWLEKPKVSACCADSILGARKVSLTLPLQEMGVSSRGAHPVYYAQV